MMSDNLFAVQVFVSFCFGFTFVFFDSAFCSFLEAYLRNGCLLIFYHRPPRITQNPLNLEFALKVFKAIEQSYLDFVSDYHFLRN